MNCSEAAECVSALFDGEPISREAAAHLAGCEACRARLNNYAVMGAELRDVASAAAPQAIPEGHWKLAGPAAATDWLTKWRGTMRIPRFAFALMLIAIFALSGGLALVKARPGGNGPWLLLTFKVPPNGKVMHCSTKTDHETEVCSLGVLDLPGHIWISVRFIKREGERVQLAIKNVYHDPAAAQRELNGETAQAALRNVLTQEYWLEPDRTLGVQVAGLGTIIVSGQFREREPVMANDPQEPLDPEPDEFRLLYPVLIRDNQVVVNLAGGSATATGSEPAVVLFSPGLGRFIFSPVPFQGAIQAKVQASQVSFILEGKEYLLLTGAPITRSEHVWVLHQPDWRRPASESNASAGPFIESAGSVQVFLKTE